jgi:hypothetical protein
MRRSEIGGRGRDGGIDIGEDLENKEGSLVLRFNCFAWFGLCMRYDARGRQDTSAVLYFTV